MDPLRVSVFETIYPEVTIYPASIQLPPGPLAQGMTNHVIIRGNGGDLKLSSPAQAFPAGGLPQRRSDQSSILSFRRLPPGFQILPGQSVLLTVQTDSPRFPLLTVR